MVLTQYQLNGTIYVAIQAKEDFITKSAGMASMRKEDVFTWYHSELKETI